MDAERLSYALRATRALVASAWTPILALRGEGERLVICPEEDPRAVRFSLSAAMARALSAAPVASADPLEQVLDHYTLEGAIDAVAPGGLAAIASETGATQAEVVGWLNAAIRRADRLPPGPIDAIAPRYGGSRAALRLVLTSPCPSDAVPVPKVEAA